VFKPQPRHYRLDQHLMGAVFCHPYNGLIA
jgi:hypothetical protein